MNPLQPKRRSSNWLSEVLEPPSFGTESPSQMFPFIMTMIAVLDLESSCRPSLYNR